MLRIHAKAGVVYIWNSYKSGLRYLLFVTLHWNTVLKTKWRVVYMCLLTNEHLLAFNICAKYIIFFFLLICCLYLSTEIITFDWQKYYNIGYDNILLNAYIQSCHVGWKCIFRSYVIIIMCGMKTFFFFLFISNFYRHLL